MRKFEGINIYSGEKGLGAALTNPTELARRKGNLGSKFPVTFRGETYPDAEAAYQACKSGDVWANDWIMQRIICRKFQQHIPLFEAVCQRGGVFFLQQCSHLTGAKTERFQRWEGKGEESRFIRNLVAGFKMALRSF